MPIDIRKGTNISHWLSQSKARGDERRAGFTADDVKRIAEWGFDHIRLPIDEEQLWTDTGARESEAFDLLGSALRWCADEGLRAIVDLHIIRSHHFSDTGVPELFTDPDEVDRLAGLWVDLSAFLREGPNDQVAYELLNEPVAPSDAMWNATWRAPYDALRSLEPERTIVLGSNWFNAYRTFSALEIPEDPNLILTFHYYEPMFITHYTARWWRGGSYSGPIRYPGRPIPESQHIALERLKADGDEEQNREFSAGVMKADMMIPFRVARERALPLYCGEFGCYENTPEDIREAWYRDIIAVFDELGIAWANRDYRGSFGLLKEGRETPVLEWLLGAAGV